MLSCRDPRSKAGERKPFEIVTNKPIGEIIEAGTTAFVAQCLEVPREIVPRLYDPPPFGSFVKIGKPSAGEAIPPALWTVEKRGPFAAAVRRPRVPYRQHRGRVGACRLRPRLRREHCLA